ncbi:MAG: hypothetical protein ACTHLH_00160 [Solirubrobacterales bacterium]
MQTMAPPEETPQERAARIDERFNEVNRRITEGREETKERFNRLEGDIRQLREVDIRQVREVDIRDLREGDIRELKQGLAAVQTNLNRFVVGAVSGWVVLMVTLLAKGG